jgi:hypothetical protein
LGVAGSFACFLGILLYNKYFQETELRTVYLYYILLSSVAGIQQFIFVLGYNKSVFGVSDTAWLYITQLDTPFFMAWSFMPGLVLLSKIIPKNIEASLFAFATGILNFSSNQVSSLMGVYVNKWFVGADENNLDETYITITYISFFTTFIPLLFLHLLPTWDQID